MRSELDKIKKKSKISILKTFNAAESADFENGFLIFNPKGSADLKLIGGTASDRHSHEILVYKNKPLLKIRSVKTLFDEETEKEVSAGLGLDSVLKNKSFLPENISENNLETLLYTSHNLINSLYPSLYFVIKKDFYPASGDGSYFQSLNTDYKKEPSSVSLFEKSSSIDHCFNYLMPLKPELENVSVLNKKMLDFGKNKQGLAVALYLGNGFTVLIDGHARAAAAAMLGKKLPVMLICPAARYISKAYNKFNIEFASLSTSIPSLPEKFSGEGFFRPKDCDRPVKEIDSLISLKNSAFDNTPLGSLNSISYPPAKI